LAAIGNSSTIWAKITSGLSFVTSSARKTGLNSMSNSKEPGKGTSILIAEDEPNIVESLTFLLEREGYAVSAVTDGDKALRILQQAPPGLLVLDVMLPGRNGFEILKAIRADGSLAGLPVVVLTAKGQEKDRKTAMDLGANAFITKPFSNQDLVDQINQISAAAN
jgi:DNA-binding response OmpR family regulator